jgi:hypothetical protein
MINFAKNPDIIGLCGVARCGKDTFFSFAEGILENSGIKCERLAFADELKTDLDAFLKLKMGIEAFTEDRMEKSIIRPVLVAYGAAMRDLSEGMYWIDKLEPKIQLNIASGICSIITDVRYKNELSWIHGYENSSSLYIERDGLAPANEEEAANDPDLREFSYNQISWETFGSNNLDHCLPTVEQALNEILPLWTPHLT